MGCWELVETSRALSTVLMEATQQHQVNIHRDDLKKQTSFLQTSDCNCRTAATVNTLVYLSDMKNPFCEAGSTVSHLHVACCSPSVWASR